MCICNASVSAHTYTYKCAIFNDFKHLHNRHFLEIELPIAAYMCVCEFDIRR